MHNVLAHLSLEAESEIYKGNEAYYIITTVCNCSLRDFYKPNAPINFLNQLIDTECFCLQKSTRRIKNVRY